jgi:hypothetical protein
MEKIFNYLKSNPLYIIIVILVLALSYKGAISYWVDLKEAIVQTELKQKGIILEQEERVILSDIEKASEESQEAIEEVSKVDYQTHKKNVKSKAQQKGIKVTDSDIKYVNSADSILAKWRKR